MPLGIGKLTRLERLSEFLIARDHSTSKLSGGLDELHSLNNLTGDLTIKNMRWMKNAAVAAVHLSSKLENLILEWDGHGCNENDVFNEEKGMEALCPHLNLKVLQVWKYPGVKHPSWLPSITSLAHFRIEYCSSLRRLPSFDHLPRLNTLFFCGLTKLESIDVENRGRSSPFFPFLAHLKLRNCPNLKEFQRHSSSSSTEELPCFPCLSQLDITFCPNLIHLPLFSELENRDFNVSMELVVSDGSKALNMKSYGGVKPPTWLPSITNLVSVTIEDSGSLQRLPPFDHIPHLKKLRISNLPCLELIDVDHNRGGFFPSLTELTIWKCRYLKGLLSLSKQELPCFPCLSSLSVRGCANLTHLPLSPEVEHLEWDGMKSLKEILKMPANSAFTLSRLQHLSVSNMEDCIENELNDGMQWQSLQALCSVSFVEMQNMVSLPKGLQYATTLQHLYISGCPSLECIPDWIPNLVALQDLTINYSQRLEERCNNNSAEDWAKISHIPNVEIGWKNIRKDDCYQL